MNSLISRTGAVIVALSVFLFAVFLAVDYTFGSYVVCMFLPIGYIIMSAGFQHECCSERKVAANAGVIFAAVYAVLIFIVYFTQTTSVAGGELGAEALRLLDFKRGGLLFNYDLLGYGMMALSTFFIGLSMRAERKADKWLKGLMMVHGAFFPCCFILPMTGAFAGMAEGSGGSGGTIALLFWCAYFLPVGILAFLHFGRRAEGGSS